MLRESGTGRPGPLARLVALAVAIGMLVAAGPPLVAVARWLLSMV